MPSGTVPLGISSPTWPRWAPGSSKRPSASPATAKVKTISPSAMPGKSDGHHWPMISDFAPDAIMAPSSGVGGATPAPTKLSPAVRRIANPTVTEIWTRIGGSALGSRCRKPIRRSELPSARAASA